MHALAKAPRGVGGEILVKFFIDHRRNAFPGVLPLLMLVSLLHRNRHPAVHRQSVLIYRTYPFTCKEAHLRTTQHMQRTVNDLNTRSLHTSLHSVPAVCSVTALLPHRPWKMEKLKGHLSGSVSSWTFSNSCMWAKFSGNVCSIFQVWSGHLQVVSLRETLNGQSTEGTASPTQTWNIRMFPRPAGKRTGVLFLFNPLRSLPRKKNYGKCFAFHFLFLWGNNNNYNRD